MTVNENPFIIHLSCNENLHSPARTHSDNDPPRTWVCSCRHFCRDFLSKMSTAKWINIAIYNIVESKHVCASVQRMYKNYLNYTEVSNSQTQHFITLFPMLSSHLNNFANLHILKLNIPGTKRDIWQKVNINFPPVDYLLKFEERLIGQVSIWYMA